MTSLPLSALVGGLPKSLISLNLQMEAVGSKSHPL